jgi:hypothetical protein
MITAYWAARRRWPRSELLRQIHPVILAQGPIAYSSPYGIGYALPTLYVTLFSFSYIK